MPATNLPNLGLGGDTPNNEDNWDVQDRANLRRLDAVHRLSVKDKDLNTPPGSPADGDRYIVGPSPTGAWAGQAGKVTAYNASTVAGHSPGWDFYTPKDNWLAYVVDEQMDYVYFSAAWEKAAIRERLKTLERFYPFSVVPTTQYNTYAGGEGTITLETPAVILQQTVAALRSNKIIEVRVETKSSDEFVEGFDNSDGNQFPMSIGCQMWASAFTAANVDEACFAGIEWGGYGVTTQPFPTLAGQGLVMLRQHLKTKGTWDLLCSLGDGSATSIATLTDVAFTPPGEGHRLMLVSDPFAGKVYGYIDGRKIGPLTFNMWQANMQGLAVLQSGLFMTSGVQTGSGSLIQAYFSSFHSAHYNTHLPGAA
jgi:uncharacterized protein DUF2793